MLGLYYLPMANKPSQPCAAAALMDILGRRHTPHVIYLLKQAPMGFCEIEEAMQVNTATLARRLGELEEAGLVEKKHCPKDARHVYYSLSKRGKKVATVLGKLSDI